MFTCSKLCSYTTMLRPELLQIAACANEHSVCARGLPLPDTMPTAWDDMKKRRSPYHRQGLLTLVKQTGSVAQKFCSWRVSHGSIALQSEQAPRGNAGEQIDGERGVVRRQHQVDCLPQRCRVEAAAAELTTIRERLRLRVLDGVMASVESGDVITMVL